MDAEIKKQLHEAINTAQGYGECQYTEGGNPCCVVGQFLYARGATIKELKACENAPIDVRFGEDERPYMRYMVELRKRLVPDYDLWQLLIALQDMWDAGPDSAYAVTESQRRVEMRKMVEEAEF